MSTTSATLGTVNAVAVIATSSAGSVAVNLVPNSFTGTLVFEATSDLVNWFGVAAWPMLGAGILGGAQLSTSSFTANTQFVIPVYGYTAVRVRVTSATNGTALVLLDGAFSAPAGYLYTNVEGQKPTYSGAAEGFTPAATPQDFVALTNPVTLGKIVRILRVGVNGFSGSGASFPILLVKRTTLNSGGSPTTVPAVAHDSADAAATATLQVYAGAPSMGSPLVVRAQRLTMPIGGTAGNGIVWDFGSGRPGRALMLRPGEMVSLNGNGAAVPARGVIDFEVEWSEE